ncbi:MAG: helix-turn-helix transcriptional regulator, partial [Chloroflexi bacterium]
MVVCSAREHYTTRIGLVDASPPGPETRSTFKADVKEHPLRTLSVFGGSPNVAGGSVAHARLAESLRLLGDIGYRPAVPETLECFAPLAARQSKPEAALQLAGAAAALREAIGAVQSPLSRDLLGRWLPALQVGLGDDGCARGWAIGQAIPVQQAISLALGLRESGPADSPASAYPRTPGPAGLTSREVEVLRLVAQGRSNKEISAELVLSVRTVERQITNLYGKIHAAVKPTPRLTRSTTTSCYA